jgi:hypothetical protein
VRRNEARFPKDFVFSITPEEKAEVAAKCDHLSNLKFSKVLPLAFTEHGALMAASVLRSSRAAEMSLFIVRAFVRLRRTIEENTELAWKLRRLESRLSQHDEQILVLVRSIRRLAEPDPLPPKRRIGFGKP